VEDHLAALLRLAGPVFVRPIAAAVSPAIRARACLCSGVISAGYLTERRS